MLKEIKTSNGLLFQVDDNVFDDMEVIDALAEMQKGDVGFVSGYPMLVKKVLGDEQRKTMYDALRDENGRVPVQAVGETMGEILSLLKKNT